ncbi:hypothetical protein J6590_039172 [Homalodisca vitripennis]|nr:hypothetical protein J6590_039172 [Homalodisca vitripennis]
MKVIAARLLNDRLGVTKECSWRRPIERIGQRDVATQQVPNSPARRAAVTARNKFGNVAYSSLAAPRSRSKKAPPSTALSGDPYCSCLTLIWLLLTNV